MKGGKMYCTHCAKKIDEAKLESQEITLAASGEELPADAKVAYVCPRCGHLIHADVSEEETKSLAQAAHAQVQRARNDISTGQSLTYVGGIALIIAIIFYILACKPTNQYQLVVTCAEFFVFIVLGIISVILLVVGIVKLVKGLKGRKENTELLKDINNRTFVQ